MGRRLLICRAFDCSVHALRKKEKLGKKKEDGRRERRKGRNTKNSIPMNVPYRGSSTLAKGKESRKVKTA